MMNPRIQEALKRDCLKYDIPEDLEDLRQNIKLICNIKGSPVGSTEPCTSK